MTDSKKVAKTKTSKKNEAGFKNFSHKLTNFLKEWGLFTLFFLILILSRIFIWTSVSVDGHSMDPTLAANQRLIVVKTAKIDRFDIVVAKENENGKKKQIVKRVIGMPGDTITYENDTLYVNGKKINESYLKEYRAAFAKDKLQSTYTSDYFRQLARSSSAFTVDKTGANNFTVIVPKGQYFLLGDDRIVSKDSREVGTFSKDAIVGEVKFRFWPVTKIGTVE
ncbi:signal peptidase I [Streptococcus dentapri]|uniref:Signal peptidase I n=1 Tax=Streptococcus dentapri TaxID=573564 RepID=A0ABV8D0C2_9STRE